MAKTYRHTPATSATADQDWINDVTDVVSNTLQWDGVSVNPIANSVIMDKQSNRGIFVDRDDPTHPWADLLGDIHVDEAAASNKPTFSVFNGPIKQFRFAVDDQVYANYHIPHDYVLGSNLYIHAHWSSSANSVGSVQWQFDVCYAAGHGEGSFSNVVNTTVTQAFTGQYKHMIAETILSSPSGNSSTIDSNAIQIDGVVTVRAKLLTNTMASNPFLHYVDIHYQSTGIGTKNKAPNFYG